MGKRALFCFLIIGPIYAARPASNRYALLLDDPPVSRFYSSRESMRSAAASTYRQQIRAKHAALRSEIASRGLAITGEVDTLLNAVFVAAPAERAAELASLPGVSSVITLRYYKLDLNRAVTLVDASGAWNALGGVSNAGLGVKVAILDTGIDQTHPAFQDPSLVAPSGFPICSGTDCAFTSNKVIVARSYVSMLAAGTSITNPAADSRPDDISPRDHTGHGTAVASVVAGNTNTGLVTITGMAPRAFLGNYRIFGSPEVNDTTSDDVVMVAAEQAMNDGMDIITLSLGAPAFTGPLDSGSTCGVSTGAPCDPLASALETAAKAGMIVVIAAGNDGLDGVNYPSFNTITSPGDAPSVIAVGASTNSHAFTETVSVPGTSQNYAAYLGDGTTPSSSLTAPGIDVSTLGGGTLACSALPSGSLAGAIALIERGTCTFLLKLQNAVAAGAVGVIYYMADSTATILPGGLGGTNQPAVMISNADGSALQRFLDANPRANITIDPAEVEQLLTVYNQLASFSSQGPVTGTSALKPDLIAVGTNMYMAAESYDPLGEVYGANGYAVANGTSFATPMVTGAAAMVKQSHRNWTAAQVKSALVNNATQDVSQMITQDDSGDAVTAQSIGAGKLDAGAALAATITAAPATISFGAITRLSAAEQIVLTNNGAASVTLAIANDNTHGAPGVLMSFSQSSLTLASGASSILTITLSGTFPPAGSYSGAVTITGQNVSMSVPYLYMVASGVAANLIPLYGDGYDGTVGDTTYAYFKLVDGNGLPVASSHVLFTSSTGAQILGADPTTDAYGIGAAEYSLGSSPGAYSITATAGGQQYTFTASARAVPNISSISNAAAANPGSAVAPGSYISIFGSALSDDTDSSSTARLPLAIDYVIVSFDVPSAGISVPGHLTYVSPSQVNVQVPWELEGQTSAQVKVTIDYSYGNVVTLPLQNFAPSFLEVLPGAVAALDMNYATIGASNPAVRGQSIALYANGLGPVTNTPASGDPASSTSLAATTSTPVVTIGGATAPVSFSGLAPGFAGLYQINVTVPSTIAAGQQPVVVSIGGQTSKASGIMVR
jgi:minor extracellular serine protease Vpr